MTYGDFLSFKFYPSTFNGTWISDTEILFQDQYGGLSVHHVDSRETRTMISHNQFLRIHSVTYKLSADRRYLLVQTSKQRVWRRSSVGGYALLKLGKDGRPTSSKLLSLAPPIQGDLELPSDKYLRLVMWAPVGNALAYVDYNNNIYYRATAEGSDVQVTSTGQDGLLYNGIPDWVSEEETFEDNKALWWSPDGSRIVYGVFDDSDVDVINLPRYGSWSTAKTDRHGYPFLQNFIHDEFRYPKAGRTNPRFKLMAAEVGEGVEPLTQQELHPPRSMQAEENHFTSVVWPTKQTVAVNWMNRVQNLSVVTVCPLSAGTKAHCTQVLEVEEPHGWVDYKFQPIFNKHKENPSRFLAILPAPSLQHRPRQLFLVEDGSKVLLTKQPDTEVTEVHGWTSDDRVFYTSTLPGEPGTRHLYVLKLGSQGEEPECLTCNTQEMVPELRHRHKCQFVTTQLSAEGSYYAMDCGGPGIPYTCLHATEDNSLLGVWEPNSRLERIFSKVDSPTVQYRKISVPGTEQKARVMLYLPPGYQEAQEPLPMLVEVYGGPGFQKVDKQWQGYSWPSYVAGSLGIVYAIIDPRGSGFQGDDWRHSVYRNFGTVEVEDTLTVTKSLQKLPFVDSERTAIWGWSYGGYLSLSVLTRDTGGIFSCGASVAPVVRWELYDTIYTERYMSTPEDNPEGYNTSSPLWRLDTLKDKQYYLIHGTHDDNVHYQQSMLLSAALEEKDILFRQQSYPDQDHSIGDYRRHLYHSLGNFFIKDCFNMARRTH